MRGSAHRGARRPARVHRRHVPPLLAHAAQRRAGEGRPRAPEGQVRGREERPHRRGARQPRVPRGRLPGPGRRRRHAELRRGVGPPRVSRGGAAQDDGQRRARHRLLHGLRHLREPHRAVCPSGHELGSLARAHRGARGLRPLRRLHGAAADLRGRRSALPHPRARVRRGTPRRAARRRPQRAPRPPLRLPGQRRRHAGGRRDGLRGRREGPVRARQARRHRPARERQVSRSSRRASTAAARST